MKETNQNLPKVRGVELIEQCITCLEKGKNRKKAKPVPKEILSALKFVSGKMLPSTLLHFFEYDLTFNSISYGNTQCRNTEAFGNNPRKPKLIPVDLNAVIKSWIGFLYDIKIDFKKMRIFDLKEKSIENPILLLAHQLPGNYYQLPNLGDQLNFLYVGKSDSRGEYPIIGFDWEGSFDKKTKILTGQVYPFFKYPAFDLYLADMVKLYDFGSFSFEEIPQYKKESKAMKILNPELDQLEN